jgi:hypothetical protein
MLRDVCNAFDIKKSTTVKSRLDPRGCVKSKADTFGGRQKATFIDKDNLLYLAATSKKPRAYNFLLAYFKTTKAVIDYMGIWGIKNNIFIKPERKTYTDIINEQKGIVSTKVIAKDYGVKYETVGETLLKLNRKVFGDRVLNMIIFLKTAQFIELCGDMSFASTLVSGTFSIGWTQAGRRYIYKTFKRANILPLVEQ